MKRKVLLLILTTFAICAYGHHSPFAEEGKRWNYRYTCSHPDAQSENYDYSYFIYGDTIINGITCKKLYYEKGDETTYKGATYEEVK